MANLPPSDSAPPASALFKAFRTRFGLSQADAAPFFGVSVATFGNWELDKRTQGSALVLARLLLAKPELLQLLQEQDQAVMSLEPEISCTFASTTADPPEAVKVVWVTSEDDPGARTILVGHQGGIATLTRPQWDAWCERVGARIWAEDARRLRERD